MADRKYYVLCEQNCKFEGMTKEQILTAITQAVKDGTVGDIDTGFVTTIKTINNKPLKFFVGTQSEYEALSASERESAFAIITDDSAKEGILAAIEDLQEDFDDLHDGLLDGSVEILKATKAKQDGNGKVIADTYAKKNDLTSGAIKVAKAEAADSLVLSKTYFDDIVEGARNFPFEYDSVYLITARLTGFAEGKRVAFMLVIPSETSNVNEVHSTMTTGETYCKATRNGSTWSFCFYGYDDAVHVSTNVYIRKI